MQNYGNMHDASPSSYGAVCSITVCTGDTSPIITIPGQTSANTTHRNSSSLSFLTNIREAYRTVEVYVEVHSAKGSSWSRG